MCLVNDLFCLFGSLSIGWGGVSDRYFILKDSGTTVVPYLYWKEGRDLLLHNSFSVIGARGG